MTNETTSAAVAADAAGPEGATPPRPCLVVATGLGQNLLGSSVDTLRGVLPDFDL